MAVNLTGMSPAEKYALMLQLQEDHTETVRKQHYPAFIRKVGLRIILDLPVVNASTLGLDKVSKYHEKTVVPSMLGDHSAVRGADGANRPFIAIKCDLFNATGEKVTQVVELVFKRYSLDGEGANDRSKGDNYVTALHNRGADGKTYDSFYSSGGLTGKQIESVGMLLKGELITVMPTRKGGPYTLKMADSI